MDHNPQDSLLRSQGRVHRVSKLTVTALSGLFLLGILGGAFALQKAAPLSMAARHLDGNTLFTLTNIWTVHLSFSSEQWEAMEPSGGGFGPFGGPGGPERESRGPGEGSRGMRGGPGFMPQFRGGPPGGPGGFGPGMFIAPAFMKQADANHDDQLSQTEFMALAEKWFAAWDTNHCATLDESKIRAGLNTSLSMGGFFRGPGGPGGGPGRGPGLMLQGADGKRNGLASAMGIEFKWVHADLDFDGIKFKDVAVRYKGNGTFMESRGSLKRSLKVDLSKYEGGRALGGVRILNLHNNVTDASWMNEPLSHKLYRDAGVPAPRSSYARVYVSVPGKFDKQYFGLYSLVENVDGNFARDRFGTRRGALFKPVTRTPFEDMGNDWSKYKQAYDPKIGLYEDQAQRVIDFCKLVSHGSDAQLERELGNYLDLDEFARFMAVTTYLSTMDSILSVGQNYLVHLNAKTGQLQFIPWDLDHSFGQFPMIGSAEQRENLSIKKPWTDEIRLLDRVFKTQAFRSLYLARLREFDETIFRPERFSQQVDELGRVLRPAIQEESADKLERFDTVVSGQAVQPGGFGGRGFGGPPGFGQQMKPIKPFVKVRSQSIHEQLAGKSEGETIGGGFGMGGRGPGGPGRFGGPGGPAAGGFGPGNFLAGTFVQALDADHDGLVTHSEFIAGFKKWFESWDTDHKGALAEDMLREGLNRDLSPFRGGPPPGFGPPPDENEDVSL